ncbi:serine hydrolase domain-containing protein [Falsarthrobacter nasiphocae]|uniref:CubicO group peptidase (Beta-lactamase class C family) n=1 Tax=Falsarthrobacter nasiphocae TaxID=189863 RepID=A0AAE4C6B6_9MICC|nr:serine hydrolase domain-containing protein [Falsarthrobacter nasiphocae]MDR6892403.1 CubicO group peptidase (beta-lactamase class C family) [Falsarthrobacter nasiphocae]
MDAGVTRGAAASSEVKASESAKAATKRKAAGPNPQIAAWKEALRVGEPLLGALARNVGLPGFQVSVSVDGKRVGDIAWGMADVEAERPMTPTTLMRVASHSKTFTATAILQLFERGVLRLDDRLDAWLPELADSPLGEATISELLSHTAGVTRDSMDSDFWSLGRPFPSREEIIEIARTGNVILRNERMKYTNVGYSLLGLIIEAATGGSYTDWVQSGILGPLRLANTGPELDDRADELATGYTGRGADATDPFLRVPIDHVNSRGMVAATGFYSTARDLCRYFSAHLPASTEFERKRTDVLLEDGTKRLAQRPVYVREGRGYGLGFMFEEIGGRATFGHSGGYPGFISRTWAVPETGVVVSVLTNAVDGDPVTLGRSLFALADLALAPAHPSLAGVKKKVLRRFDESFSSLWGATRFAFLGHNIYEFELGYPVDPKSLPYEYVDESSLRMQDPYGFGAHGELARFEFDDDGRAASVRTANGSLMTRGEFLDLPDRMRLGYTLAVD